MDFILELPRSKKGLHYIFIVVNRFYKMMHFISYYKIDDTTNITYLFFKKIVQLHKVLKSIVSNDDVKCLDYF